MEKERVNTCGKTCSSNAIILHYSIDSYGPHMRPSQGFCGTGRNDIYFRVIRKQMSKNEGNIRNQDSYFNEQVKKQFILEEQGNRYPLRLPPIYRHKFFVGQNSMKNGVRKL